MSDRSSQYGHNSRNKKYGAGEQFAIRRLLKELKEIRTYPMPNVVAEPTEEDLFTWHGNLRGPAQSPFEGGVFHFVIHFPRNYPNSAPTININDSIPGHPFVEGNSICLSLLENSRGRNDNWYYGWTPVYTAGSILRQLQTVLVDGLESFRDSAGYNVSFTQKQTSQWKIVFDNRDTQGEGTLDPEQIRELLLEVGERKPSEEELALHYRMLNFPKDQPIDFSTFLRILERKRDFRRVVETANKYHCPHKTCSHAPQHPYPAFPSVDKQNAAGQALVEKSYERIRLEETVCFHSKQSPTEPDNATLGVGLSFQRDFRNGKIHRISSSMDLVSLNAFRKWGINYSAGTERETFTHWLPMYLNAEHGARAMHLAPRCFGIICNGSHRDFKVDMVTEIIPKLMSGLILEIVKGGSQLAIQALHGYTYLHQLFLALVQRYPHLGEIIKQQLTDFIADPENRVKDKFSNLTDVLCLLSVAEGIDFKAAFTAVMEEMNIRNVIWIVKKYPELNKDTPDAKLDAERINKSFVASRVGFQVVLFHRFFLDHIARPKSATNEQVLAAYEATWGRPTVEQEENLLVEYERIFSLPSYEEAYHRVQVDVPDQAAYLQILLNAVKVSSERSYHGKRKITVQSVDEYLKQKVKNYINLDDLIDQEKSDELTQQRNVPDEKFFVLKDDEEFWKKNCGERFGALELPESDDIVSEIQQPWRHLYLKLNLEDIICKFNENPDFKRFYRTVELSAYHLRLLELTVVPVTNVKSNFYYITALLTKLYHLEKFVIHKGEITLGLKGCKALCKGLKNNPNSLRALDIHYCHFTSECVKIVEEGLLSSHGLLALNLEGNPLGAEGAKSIAAVLQAHGGITHLNITSCGITDDGARQLADAFYHNKSLRVIHMGKNPWTHVGFAQIIHKLAYSRTIEELHLQHISESINNLAVSAAFTRLFEVTTSLKYVNFFKTKVSRILDETSIHGLSQNRSLTELDLSNTGFEGNENFKHLGFALARNRNIIKLDLEQASAQPNSLAIISQAIHDSESAIEERKKAVKVRPLNAFEITEELRPRGCSLQHLNYSGNSTSVSSPGDSKALSRLISLTTSLTSLNLSSCNLDVLAGEAIGNGIRNHPALLTLDVSRNNLGEYGIKKLCKGLAENNVIQELNLSRNKSGGRGISAVAQLMTNPNTNIRVLNIYGNLIGIEGARFVATALETNKTVTDLDLGLNRIRAKGTSAIAASLTKNNTLQILRLKQNFINDRPAMELAKVLVAHKSITKLCIAGNRVKDAILNSIVSSLAERNPPATVDIAQLLKVTENSVLQRTIYCTPLSMDVSENSLKKVFYDGGCGAIVKVSIIKHSKRTSFDKACFAFIEFAEQGSVQLALDIGAEQKSRIGKKKFSVIQAQGKAGHGSVVTPQ